MIGLTELPAIGSGIEIVRINETLLMGTLVHVIEDDGNLKAVGLQDISGAMYWVTPDEIGHVRPFRVGPLP